MKMIKTVTVSAILAMSILATSVVIADTTTQDIATLTKQANQGIAQAQYNLGLLYEDGKDVPQDYRQAEYWYKKSANQGHPEAQFNLGLLYEHGQGIAQDYNQAKYWYEKSANQGNTNAQYNLAIMYADGKGVTQDYNQARYWYEKAAKQGEASAQYNLAIMYIDGKSVPQNYSLAEYWYQQSCNKTDNPMVCNAYYNAMLKKAKAGDADAQYRVGVLYTKSVDSGENHNSRMYCQIKKRCQKATIQKHLLQYRPTILFQGGGERYQNYNKAVYWYEKAAMQEHAEAQLALAFMYAQGKVIRKDNAKAKEWFKKACDNGLQKGCDEYQKIK